MYFLLVDFAVIIIALSIRNRSKVSRHVVGIALKVALDWEGYIRNLRSYN